MAIYVKFKRQRTLKEFLTLLFSYPSDGYLRNVTTYHDEECTKIQCEAGKNRSIDDILEIVNTYYPSITIKRLCQVLFNLKIKHDHIEYSLHGLRCGTINRSVLLFTPFTCDYHNKNSKSSSKWTIRELYEMSKIK